MLICRKASTGTEYNTPVTHNILLSCLIVTISTCDNTDTARLVESTPESLQQYKKRQKRHSSFLSHFLFSADRRITPAVARLYGEKAKTALPMRLSPTPTISILHFPHSAKHHHHSAFKHFNLGSQHSRTLHALDYMNRPTTHVLRKKQVEHTQKTHSSGKRVVTFSLGLTNLGMVSVAFGVWLQGTTLNTSHWGFNQT